MITSHTEALEGLRMALAQLHDVRLYMADQPDSEHSWAAGVAYDWIRLAIHRGEEEVLHEVLTAMHSGFQHIGVTSVHICEENDYRCCEEDTCPEGCAHRLSIEELTDLQTAHDAQCGPLCEAHGDPRDTSMARTTDFHTTAPKSPLSGS